MFVGEWVGGWAWWVGCEGGGGGRGGGGVKGIRSSAYAVPSCMCVEKGVAECVGVGVKDERRKRGGKVPGTVLVPCPHACLFERGGGGKTTEEREEVPGTVLVPCPHARPARFLS